MNCACGLPAKKFKRMCEIYKIFAPKDLDFSQKAFLDMYRFETFGVGNINIDGFNALGKVNGYAVGKKFCNVQVASWLEDCSLFVHKEGCLAPVENPNYRGWFNVIHELYNDSTFPRWWIKKVFSKFLAEKRVFYGENFVNPLEDVKKVSFTKKGESYARD